MIEASSLFKFSRSPMEAGSTTLGILKDDEEPMPGKRTPL